MGHKHCILLSNLKWSNSNWLDFFIHFAVSFAFLLKQIWNDRPVLFFRLYCRWLQFWFLYYYYVSCFFGFINDVFLLLFCYFRLCSGTLFSSIETPSFPFLNELLCIVYIDAHWFAFIIWFAMYWILKIPGTWAIHPAFFVCIIICVFNLIIV